MEVLEDLSYIWPSFGVQLCEPENSLHLDGSTITGQQHI